MGMRPLDRKYWERLLKRQITDREFCRTIRCCHGRLHDLTGASKVVAAEPKAVPRPWAGGHKVYAPDATQKCSYPDADTPERISRLTTGSTQSRTDLLFCVRALPSVSPGFGSRWCRPVPSREVWNSRAKADPAPDNFGGGWATGIYSEPTVADAPSWLTAPLPKNKPRIYRRSIK